MAAPEPSRLVAAYGLFYLGNRPTLIRAANLPDASLSALSAGEWRRRLAQLRQSGANAVALDVPPPPPHALVDALRDEGLALIQRGTAQDDDKVAGVATWVSSETSCPLPDAPLAVSLDTLYRRSASDDTHPVSNWRLPLDRTMSGTVLAIAAAVAHGAKGYAIALPLEGSAAHSNAIARLQAFLGALEEELTASIEVHDPIAWLRYPPDSVDSLSGFHALLLTCGYNPLPLDLKSAGEESLAQHQTAILPSRGLLDLDSYGKLVVFSLRGGNLITFPLPPTRQPDGAPFRSTFLWPHLADEMASRDGTGLRSILQRLRPPRESGTLATADGATLRAEGSVHHFPSADRPFVRYGTGYRQHERTGGLVALQSQILLRHRGIPAAYRAQIRDGVSTVIGTNLGSAYDTSRYHALSPAERLALRRFVINLVEDSVPRKIVPDDPLEVEAIARLSPDGGCLLFILNRLGPQTGTIHLPAPETLNLSNPLTTEVLFSASGATASSTADSLHVSLAANDVLVVRLQ